MSSNISVAVMYLGTTVLAYVLAGVQIASVISTDDLLIKILSTVLGSVFIATGYVLLLLASRYAGKFAQELKERLDDNRTTEEVDAH